MQPLSWLFPGIYGRPRSDGTVKRGLAVRAWPISPAIRRRWPRSHRKRPRCATFFCQTNPFFRPGAIKNAPSPKKRTQTNPFAPPSKPMSGRGSPKRTHFGQAREKEPDARKKTTRADPRIGPGAINNRVSRKKQTQADPPKRTLQGGPHGGPYTLSLVHQCIVARVARFNEVEPWGLHMAGCIPHSQFIGVGETRSEPRAVSGTRRSAEGSRSSFRTDAAFCRCWPWTTSRT